MSVILPLFWCETLPETQGGAIDFQTPTVNIKHAGVSLQRNYVSADNESMVCVDISVVLIMCIIRWQEYLWSFMAPAV